MVALRCIIFPGRAWLVFSWTRRERYGGEGRLCVLVVLGRNWLHFLKR